MHRVLVIHGDRDLAAAIEGGLAGYAVEVELAGTGQAGMEAAAADPTPDLILLAVELTDANGFLLCRKLKRTARLREIPVIVLSSDENADALFEQHRQTKSTAQGYVREPIDTDGLVERIRGLLPLQLFSAAENETEGEEDMSNDDRDSEMPTRVGEPAGTIDDEIDEFAETAFNALVMNPSDLEAAKTSAPAADPSPPPTGEYEDVAFDDVIMVSDAPPEAQDSQESAESEPTDGPRTQEFETAKLRSEIAELRAKLAESSGGVSSRQFLDLREALNSKDKEILELRDEVSARDKEILDLREQTLALERQKADFDERTAGLERSLSKAQEAIAGLTQDKEAANKRYEDVKARFERASQKAQGLEEELSAERDGRAADVAALKSAHDAELARVQLAHQEATDLASAEAAAALAKTQEDHEAAMSAAAAANETALATLRSELSDERSAALAQAAAEAEAAKEAALAALREELSTQASEQMAQLEAQWRQTLSEREATLQGEKQLEVETLEKEHSKQLATLGRKLADTETELAGARERERVNGERVLELESKLAETEAHLASTHVELDETQGMRDQLQVDLNETRESRDRLQQELDSSLATIESLESVKRDLEARVGSLEAIKSQFEVKLAHAVEKIASDEAILSRARKAFAIGVSLLEDQRDNSVGASTEAEASAEDAE